jgi:APA family basic amino acid/polyamine antiporter
MYTLPATTWLRLIIWMLIGFVIYFTYGKAHSKTAAAATAANAAGLEQPV